MCEQTTLSTLLVLSPTASDRDGDIGLTVAYGQKQKLRKERRPGLWKHRSSFLHKISCACYLKKN